jgi:hypothetical protein
MIGLINENTLLVIEGNVIGCLLLTTQENTGSRLARFEISRRKKWVTMTPFVELRRSGREW